MTSDKDEAEKALYFNSLAALNESSDEEHDSDDVREVLRNFKRGSPTPSSIEHMPERMRTPATFKKVPGIQRTTSAPVSSTNPVNETPPFSKNSKLVRSESATPLGIDPSIVKEIPSLLKRSSLRRPESATPAVVEPLIAKEKPQIPKVSSLHRSESAVLLGFESSMAEETPVVPNLRFLAERRTVSDPTIGSGSLVIPYSKGIVTMLGKKGQKRKSSELDMDGKTKCRPSKRLALKEQRIFRDKIFYYVPPDDKAPRRRARIGKAEEFGAMWTKELIPETTHIVVDKPLCRKDVMDFLKMDKLPEGIIIVNEEYPVDCVEALFLLAPNQERYFVGSSKVAEEVETESKTTSESADVFLDISSVNPKSRKREYVPLDQTPPKSQGSTQRHLSKRQEEEKEEGEGDRKVKSLGTLTTQSRPASFGDMRLSEVNEKDWQPDKLDEMVDLVKDLEGVPMSDDEDREDDSRPPSRDNPEASESEDEERHKSSHGVKSPKSNINVLINQGKFICMKGGTGTSTELNPNSTTIEILEKLYKYYTQKKDEWRQLSYRKAIATLRTQKVQVTASKQAVILPNIGKSIANQIEEIVRTPGLRRLENAILQPSDLAFQAFLNIYGAGMDQAGKWVMQGHKTLDDLKSKAHLTLNQRLGIEHYDELLIRIPRGEVTALANIVKSNSALIDPEVEVIIGGSYRRGAANSGDIDFLLTKPGTLSSKDLLPYLRKLIARLTDIGFWVASLAEASEKGSSSKWHGCCVLPESANPIWRRIDFLLVPETELGAALIYFTGDDLFNRSIRLLARGKGLRLNQRGLYNNVMRGPKKVKMNEGELMEGADEKQIFAILGVPWRPPEQRICR